MSSNLQDGVMTGDAKGFGTLFEMHFTIPEYQRNYEWEKEKYSTFIDDIFEELDNDRQYFFGPIVIVSSERNDQELIDGQQRLTAFSILISLVADILYEISQTISDPVFKKTFNSTSKGHREKVATVNGSGIWTTKLTPHLDSQFFYRDILSPETPEKKIENLKSATEKSISNKAMYDTYKFFEKKIKEKYFDKAKNKYSAPDKLIDFHNNICKVENYVLLQIKLPNDKSAWQVFINLNKKGQELQAATMIKALLLSKIPQEDGTTTPRKDFTRNWNNIIDNLTDKIDFDQFLHHYFVATKENVTEKQIYSYIFDNYDTRKEAQDLIEELEKYAEYYRICVTPNNQDFGGGDAEEIISNLAPFKKNLSITHAFPILLAGYTNYYLKPAQKPKFKKLLDMTLRFFIRARTICHEEPARLEQFAVKISEMIREGKTEQEIKDEFIKEQPNQGLFNASFSDKDKSTIKLDFYILERINYWGYGHNNSELSTFAATKRSIEHIMPQTLRPEWFEHMKRRNTALTDDQIKQLHTLNLNKWGNLTPMQKDNNTALSNLPFHEKNIHPKGYQISNAYINKNIATDSTFIDDESGSSTFGQEITVEHAHTDAQYTPDDWWDFESIDRRTKTLCQKAEKIFKVT